MDSWIDEAEFKRRDKLSIIAEILDISKKGALKTQVMYKANLGFGQLNHYLEFMSKAKLIENVGNSGKDRYKATEKGLDFLHRLSELTDLLKIEEKPRRQRKS